MNTAETRPYPAYWSIPAWIFLFVLPFTHTVSLRLLSLLAASAIAAWSWSRDRDAALRDLPARYWIALWAALPVLLLPWSRDAAYSLGEIKTEIVYGLLALLAFYLPPASEPALRNALRVLLAAYAVLTLWAVGAWVHAGQWVEGRYFGGAGTFSTYLATVMPMLVVAYRLRLFGERTAIAIAALALLGLAAGFLTAQRTFWVALGAQIIVLTIVLRMAGWWKPTPRQFFLVLLASLVLAAGLLLEAARRRFGAELDLGAMLTQDPRIQNWGRVIGWIAERPLGYGFGRGIMAKVFPEMWGRPDMFWHAHNVVLDYGFQLGVAGALAILGLFGALLVHWLRLLGDRDAVVRAAGIAGALMVTGVVVRNLTNDFFQRDLALLFWALTGMLAGYANRGERH